MILIIIFIAVLSFGQSNIEKLEINKLSGSRIEVLGSSTINDFICGTPEFGLIANGKIYLNKLVEKEAVIKIKVNSLDCGGSGINNDMRESLKSDKYPYIVYTLKDAVMFKSTGNKIVIKTTGKLSVAGKNKIKTIYFTAELIGDSIYKVEGRKSISMLEFDIEPPTAFFGLIKAHPELLLNFYLKIRLKVSKT